MLALFVEKAYRQVILARIRSEAMFPESVRLHATQDEEATRMRGDSKVSSH